MSSNLVTDTVAELSSETQPLLGASRPRATGRRSRVRYAFLLTIPAILCYALLFWDLLRRMMAKTSGQFVFPLDDTYITMALAKNFALHGSWSLSHSGFQSATSTPAFLLLLSALYRVDGATVWGPLTLSCAFGLLAIFLAYRMLRGTEPLVLGLSLLAITVLAPLPVLGLLGMEHTLHIALVFSFLAAVTVTIAARSTPSASLLLLTAAMVATRYESLFMVAFAVLFFACQRQLRAAFALCAAAAAPVLLYGLVSLRNGCYWLPHSISLKGYAANSQLASIPVGLWRHFDSCLSRAPYLAALLTAILVLFSVRTVRKQTNLRAMLGIVAGAIFFHLLLADVGWVYRYEAYLVAASIAAISSAIAYLDPLRNKGTTVVFALCCALGLYQLAGRMWEAERSLPYRSAAVYQQQIQMARFLAQLEPGAAVAANDVGAINFFADIQCTDLTGLADKEIFWLKRQRKYSTDAISRITADRRVKMAVVYDTWFNDANPIGGPSLPGSWIRLQEWQTPYGQYLGGSVVSFYALDPAQSDRLQQTLDQFDSSLPAEVHVLHGDACVRKRPCLE